MAAHSPSKLLRLQSWLAAAWAGLILAVGGLAAPSLFAVLERSQAGLGAGRIFTNEARISLAVAVLLFVIERRRVRDLAEAQAHSGQPPSVMTGNLLLVLGALFLTVFGEFALHPLIEAAKAGQPTRLSFGALHGISASLFWLKAVLVISLSWRLTAQAQA
jgi:Domain of unknown function (DUF4149)